MSDLLLGKTLHGYKIERMLGRGGMGAVYEGIHEESGIRVALKVMMRNLREDPELVHRFEREARIAAQIKHANVARVMDAGDSDDVRYIVMEYIDGESLTDMLKEKGRLAGPRTLDYVRQAACGLEAAYELGVIHRDIKPANIMVTRDGVVKIVDFGLAKTEKPDSLHTATGAVMGTPHYMSPEQATGSALDHRADIYSLGAAFYQLLTGRTPFDGETALVILQKHISEEPRAIQHWNPNVPEPISQAVYRMMAKHPDDRFQTYGHLIRVLDDLIAGRDAPSMTMQVVDSNIPAPVELTAADKRRKMIFVGTAVLGFFLLGLFWFHRRSEANAAAEALAAENAAAEESTPGGGLAKKAREFKTDTVPMLHDIKKFNEQQDEEVEKFSNRRSRMNKGGEDEF